MAFSLRNHQRNEGEIRKESYNLKARNIFISLLSVNVHFSISHCKTSKAIWDALQILHQRTEDVKQSKINTLAEEYKLLHMEPSKIMASMHIKFSHIINKLENLAKTHLVNILLLRFWNLYGGNDNLKELLLKRLKTIESNARRKDKNRDENENISLKTPQLPRSSRWRWVKWWLLEKWRDETIQLEKWRDETICKMLQ